MKKLLLAVLLVVGLTASAQDKPVEGKEGKTCSKTHCKSPEKCIERLTKALELTADQQPQVKKIVEAKFAKIKEVKANTDKELKAVLTADQFAKWQEIKAKREGGKKCSKEAKKKSCCKKGKKSCSKDKKKEEAK